MNANLHADPGRAGLRRDLAVMLSLKLLALMLIKAAFFTGAPRPSAPDISRHLFAPATMSHPD